MRNLYLLEMGMNDQKLRDDIKNHRIRTVENIDITFEGKKYNMFFEFCQWKAWRLRTENMRTGKPLKHPKREVINENGLSIDTQFEREEEGGWQSSWRHIDLEKEVYKKNYNYSKSDILKIINTYSIEKYTGLILIEDEARRLIERTAGWRENNIIKNDPVFEVTDTWNDDHKVVRVTERVRTPIATDNSGRVFYRHELGDSCEIDLVTGKISG